MLKFRLKQNIEAVRFDGSEQSIEDLKAIAVGRVDTMFIRGGDFVTVPNRPGETRRIELGQWYIRDGRGENAIMDDDVFRETYELVPSIELLPA